MRVAVAQFATTSNIQENLASCISMINEAAVCKPSLIVLPEYCNTLFDGDFLQHIAEQAKKHDCYLVINVDLRRDSLANFSNVEPNRTLKSAISATSYLFSPLGDLVYQTDKGAKVATTSFGQIGLLTGYESMTFEPSRDLALQGAKLLCNSTSSFFLDQSSLHDPARAFENNVFIASANKEGYSQILSPDGRVLAKIANNIAGFTFADIDLGTVADNKSAGLHNKSRPDGTALIKQRRPELYQALTAAIKSSSAKEHTLSNSNNREVPETANVAIFATYKSNEQAIEDVCHYIENNLSDIIQLPELFFITDKTITHDEAQLAQVESLSKKLITLVSAVLRPFQYVCTSLVIEGMHQAVLISEHGVLAMQPQLHFCQRYQWTVLGDNVNIIELPLEQGNINVAMLTADDANIPEIVNIVALNDIHLLLVPFDIQEPCEVEYGLLSRAAEHRICIIAASREKSFTNDSSTDTVHNKIVNTNNSNNKKKIKTQKSTGLIANLTKDIPILTQYKSSQLQSNKPNDYINQPLVKHQLGKITKALVYPIAACNKL